MAEFFKVVNYEKYQHYKDRCPPWVKLHASVLEDFDFGCLPDASKAHAMLIWVLASRHVNKLPFHAGWVAQQIQALEKVDLDGLLSAGFIEMYQDASNLSAPSPLMLAPLEQRTEDRGQSSVAKATGEPDVQRTPLGEVMGAIRTHGYHNRKPPKRGDDARDVTVAKHLLESHPVDVVLQAIEGARLLIDAGGLTGLSKGEPFTLRLLNAPWGGVAVFPMSLDAYWKYRDRTEQPTGKRGGAVSGIGDLISRAG